MYIVIAVWLTFWGATLDHRTTSSDSSPSEHRIATNMGRGDGVAVYGPTQDKKLRLSFRSNQGRVLSHFASYILCLVLIVLCTAFPTVIVWSPIVSNLSLIPIWQVLDECPHIHIITVIDEPEATTIASLIISRDVSFDILRLTINTKVIKCYI